MVRQQQPAWQHCRRGVRAGKAPWLDSEQHSLIGTQLCCETRFPPIATDMSEASESCTKRGSVHAVDVLLRGCETEQQSMSCQVVSFVLLADIASALLL
jgi:hypothetical protein